VQDLVHAMACGHCFHEVCIVAFADSRSKTLHTVPCPICKLSRQDLAAEGDQLMAGHMPRGTGSSGSGGPVPAIDLLDDTPPPASPDEHPDDDEGKGKGNGNGKGKGKVTENGKGGKGNDEVADEVSLDDGFDLAVSVLGSSPVHRAMAKPRATGKGKAKAKPQAKATGKGKGKGAAVAAVDAAVVADDPFADDVAAGEGEGAAAAKAQAKATGKGKGKGKAVDAAAPPPAEAAAPPPADVEHPHFSSTDVLCDSCGRHEHFKRCRLIAKKSGRWQCSGCGCKTVMLRRKFGQWPTDAFSNLTPDCIERNPE
jgi:hypothetical protein